MQAVSDIDIAVSMSLVTRAHGSLRGALAVGDAAQAALKLPRIPFGGSLPTPIFRPTPDAGQTSYSSASAQKILRNDVRGQASTETISRPL